MKNKLYVFFVVLLLCVGCNGQPAVVSATGTESKQPDNLAFDTTATVVHVFVALCDNTYQGIVPVPKAIGNGQDPATNLYWGCGFGIKTYFKNSKDWKLLKTVKVDSIKLERLVFKHVSANCYLLADAYNGKYIKQCTKDFLFSSAGLIKDTMKIDNKVIGISGNSKLVAYIGHNGLMDFNLSNEFKNKDRIIRDAVILACASRQYFKTYLREANANPLLWTTNLMCPEAYSLHDALVGYIKKESDESVRTRAAKAYSKYQKCSEKAARGLLVTGW